MAKKRPAGPHTVYATGERDGVEEDHPKQEAIDDRYLHLQEGIRLVKENMDAMIGRMDV